ncbi:MAG: AGE family epimerase/isomerase [Bacteroidota bacterium]
MYSTTELIQLRDQYRNDLLTNVLPFWLKHAPDWEEGGFVFNLAQDGAWMSTDKAIWIQGRFVWLLATMYHSVEARPEWLRAAKHGLEFLERHGFAEDGKMLFLVDRAGKPLRKRRYIFSETFLIVAYAAMAQATGEAHYGEKALALFEKTITYLRTPGLLESKVDPDTRPAKGLAIPMILMVTAQEVRAATQDPRCQQWIDEAISEIAQDFVKDEFQAVMEMVGPAGEFIDSFEGRMLNPGHAIEAAWFVLHEARLFPERTDLLALGKKILDYSWSWGWDEIHGGIQYFRDVKHFPPTEYWHDMKFWWPQNEAVIANLLAWSLTGEERYARQHQQIHRYAHELFPDPEHGEWFGYFHRDGRLSTPLKGNYWKGPFHLPRMQWYCWQLLEEQLGHLGEKK